MIVVSNTSPIINLAAIERLDLLQRLYGTILIPQAVYHEIAIRGSGQAGASEVQTFQWFQRYDVQDRVLVKQLEQQLDPGEAAAIALSIERQADLLLLDERRGRMIARQLGIAVTGLLGVLLVAKQRGYLPTIRPALHDLMTKAGFWIDPELFTKVLKSADEA